MDSREGGICLYCMVGPDGEHNRQWGRVDYKTIETLKSITSTDAFCDENGSITVDFPTMLRKKEFRNIESRTTVVIEVNFDKEEDMLQIIGMGFREGFTAA